MANRLSNRGMAKSDGHIARKERQMFGRRVADGSAEAEDDAVSPPTPSLRKPVSLAAIWRTIKKFLNRLRFLWPHEWVGGTVTIMRAMIPSFAVRVTTI